MINTNPFPNPKCMMDFKVKFIDHETKQHIHLLERQVQRVEVVDDPHHHRPMLLITFVDDEENLMFNQLLHTSNMDITVTMKNRRGEDTFSYGIDYCRVRTTYPGPVDYTSGGVATWVVTFKGSDYSRFRQTDLLNKK